MAEAAEEESAELAKAQRKAWEETQEAVHQGALPKLRLQLTKLPKFSGFMRDFHRWRRDWESLQHQGDPSGSAEVKKFQLLDSVDEKIVKDLRLSRYDTAGEMFRVLRNRFGNKTTMAIQIIEELERLPVVKGNQPRKTIDLIQAVEKALIVLTDLGNTDAIKNPLAIKAIESKLPDRVKENWLTFEKKNCVAPEGRFDVLLKFLKEQEEVLEKLEQLRVEAPEKSGKWEKRAFTSAIGKDSAEEECSVCGDEKHGGRIFFCKKFIGLSLAEKKGVIKKNGAWWRCLVPNGKDGECSERFLCKKRCCRRDRVSNHHYLLCSAEGGQRGGEKKKGQQKMDKSDTKAGKFSEEQQRVLARVSPDVAEEIVKAFTNKAAASLSKSAKGESLLRENGLTEHPVLMMIMEITTNGGQTIGTLLDLASDTNYITHQAADRLRLRGEKIMLVMHGVGGMKVRVKTKRYLLKVRMWTSEDMWSPHRIVCYGLDEIARAGRVVTPRQLQKFFPEVKAEELI